MPRATTAASGHGLGAAGGFAGGSDGEFGAGGAVGKTLLVGGTVAFAGEPRLDGVATDGVGAFVDFKNARSNWLASIAA
jgi:hypothetical protein